MNFKHEILLNSFNRPIMIEECLRSIYEQRGIDDPKDVLIRILDDGSQLEVQNRIASILKDCPFPFIFSHFNPLDSDRYNEARYAVCINHALSSALKDNEDPRKVVIHYVTDDSIWFPHKLSRHDKFHAAGPQIVYNNTIRTTCKLINGHVERKAVQGIIRKPPHIGQGGEGEVLKAGPGFNFIDHISLSHKLSLIPLIEKPWWDINLEAWHAGDWLFWMKLVNLNIDFENVNEILDEKQWHDGCLQWISEHEKGLKDGSVGQSMLRE